MPRMRPLPKAQVQNQEIIVVNEADEVLPVKKYK